MEAEYQCVILTERLWLNQEHTTLLAAPWPLVELQYIWGANLSEANIVTAAAGSQMIGGTHMFPVLDQTVCTLSWKNSRIMSAVWDVDGDCREAVTLNTAALLGCCCYVWCNLPSSRTCWPIPSNTVQSPWYIHSSHSSHQLSPTFYQVTTETCKRLKVKSKTHKSSAFLRQLIFTTKNSAISVLWNSCQRLETSRLPDIVYTNMTANSKANCQSHKWQHKNYM